MAHVLLQLLLLVLVVKPAAATVQLPKWFGNGMVLQTSDSGGPPAFLAGRTVPPGEKVSITGDAGEHTVTSEAGTGRWKVTLGKSSGWKNAGTGMTITVQGATGAPAVATGALAGDVFFCSGQSNMLFSLHQAINYTAEAATLASYPNFRFFMANRALNSTAQFDLTTDDKNCDAAAPAPPPGVPAPPPPPLPAGAAAAAVM
jgi:sialate O-acetylesterase